ncbi:MAG TPA: class I SAM-dependent methyltransferase [Pyrinomonadaceae bacterium]
MIGFVKSRVKTLLNRYPAYLCRQEFGEQEFTRFNERPVEFAFVFRQIAEAYPKKILDVGTGTTALPHLMRNCGALVSASDNVRDYWDEGMLNRHYHILDDDITDTRIADRFDLITCISVLEHIEKSDAAVRNMFSLLNPGGRLVLTFPYNERSYVRNVYELPGSSYGRGAPYITQSYSRAELDRWLEENGAEVAEQEFWRYWTGEHWTVGEQVIPPQRVSAEDEHQLSCLCLRRKGA